MGLCDEASANGLLRDLDGKFVREGNQYGLIEVNLGNPQKPRSWRYQTKSTVKSLSRAKFERIDQDIVQFLERKEPKELNQNSFPWRQIFATGYGAGVRLGGMEDYPDYAAVDALYPLFVYDKLLQNPELVIRRLVAPRGKKHNSARVLESIKELLRHILQLEDKDDFDLTKSGIFVTIRGSKQPLSASGDGYHSTVTWVLDLLSWWYLYGSDNLTDIHGIVLIDEIEQHIHPRWQRNIMQLLQKSFRHVQFIATTHSPLVASGCEGIPVHSLKDGKSEEVHPFGWRAEEVYGMMGLSTSRAKLFTKTLKEYQRLDYKRLRTKELTTEEKMRLQDLREKLEVLPPDDPILLATELKNLTKFANASLKRKS